MALKPLTAQRPGGRGEQARGVPGHTDSARDGQSTGQGVHPGSGRQRLRPCLSAPRQTRPCEAGGGLARSRAGSVIPVSLGGEDTGCPEWRCLRTAGGDGSVRTPPLLHAQSPPGDGPPPAAIPLVTTKRRSSLFLLGTSTSVLSHCGLPWLTSGRGGAGGSFWGKALLPPPRPPPPPAAHEAASCPHAPRVPSSVPCESHVPGESQLRRSEAQRGSVTGSRSHSQV